MKKLLSISVIIILFASIISGCGTTPEKIRKDNVLQVYTTVYPLQYFTQQIGGDYVDVHTVYPPGSDEHTFEPSQKDMISLADADLFFFIGLGLEGFVDKAKETLKQEEVKMIATGESIHFTEEQSGENLEDDGHEHGGIDPHVWLDPIYAKDLALAIKNSLVAEMPKQKEVFEKNFLQLSKQLDALDANFKTEIQAAKHKELIVSHSAYHYWEERYGIKQISISGLSTTNEPSQKELQKLISFAKEENIHYVIHEQNFNSKLAEIVKDELNAKALTLNNLAVLTDENIKHHETYFTIMEQNLNTLKKALNE